jgi:hypothetical protein
MQALLRSRLARLPHRGYVRHPLRAQRSLATVSDDNRFVAPVATLISVLDNMIDINFVLI